MTLEDYQRKRKFSQTPEPSGEIKLSQGGPLRFVVQMHHASRPHYDFRIEAAGVLKSWAVPKGPSINAQDQRLAVQVEDHPIEYGSFEGIIPKGNYGAGTVMVWDEGIYFERNSSTREDSEAAVLKGLEQGHITLLLEGQKLQGEFALIRLKDKDPKSWLLVKKRDQFASHIDITREARSVKTGRTIEEIAAQAPSRGDVWLPARTTESDSPRGLPKKKVAIPLSSTPPPFSETPKFEKIPRRNKPMLPTPFAEPFDQSGWIFE
jgi:bifunctional non-homologous end joining protein LigD